MKIQPYPFQKSDAGRADAGYGTERRDCVVRALAVAFGRPYAECHTLAKTKFHRKDQAGVYSGNYHGWMDKNAERLSIKRPRPTIRTFLRHHPTGTYLVTIAGHAMPIVNGVVTDLSALSDLCRIKAAWKISGGAK